MNKKLKISMILISFIMMVSGIGCIAVSKHLTPTSVDKNAVKWAAEAGIIDANDFEGYENLYKAEKLKDAVDVAYDVKCFRIQQELDKEEVKHNIHAKTTIRNYNIGQQREEMFFGEEGLLSLGLGIAGIGGMGTLLGLMRKRPGDVTPQDMQLALVEATGRTTEELSIKENQLVQVVKGIQEFFNTYKNKSLEELEKIPVKDAIAEMKTFLSKAQDTKTQVAVAKIKKES